MEYGWFKGGYSSHLEEMSVLCCGGSGFDDSEPEGELGHRFWSSCGSGGGKRGWWIRVLTSSCASANDREQLGGMSAGRLARVKDDVVSEELEDRKFERLI